MQAPGQAGAGAADEVEGVERRPGASSVPPVVDPSDPGAGDPSAEDPSAEQGTPPVAGSDAPAEEPAAPADPAQPTDPADPAEPSAVPPADPAAEPDPAMTPPADGGDSSWFDNLGDLISNNPRVAEAAALRKIQMVISAGGTSPDVGAALDALGDVDCRRNAQTCVGVCSWAVLNCDECMPDAACMAALQQECSRSCR